jgi:preprotein translocase subunit YajC
MPEEITSSIVQETSPPAGVATNYKPNYSGVIMMYVVIIAIFYLFMIKPQKDKAKKRKTMLSNLKKNDNVQTTGGLRGQILDVKEDYVVMRIAREVKVEVNIDAVHLLREAK